MYLYADIINNHIWYMVSNYVSIVLDMYSMSFIMKFCWNNAYVMCKNNSLLCSNT